jgi:hypothetical protein
LAYADGRDFIIIRQQRNGESPLNHRLAGTSREIYLSCERPCDLSSILERFPKFTAGQVRAFLDDMVGKRLMFEEDGRYLSLAVRVRRQARPGTGV